MTTAAKGRKSGTKKSRYSLTPEERRERIRSAKQKLDEAVASLMTADGWKAMIESRKWLTKYSLRNVLMIIAQCPNATDVRPLSEWRKLGRYPRKGSKAIRIWAPTRKKIEVETVSPHIDQVENTQTQDKWYQYFILVNVFDVSATDGEPLPDKEVGKPKLLTGDGPEGLWDALANQVRAKGYTLERGCCDGANGYVDFITRTVRIRDDVDSAQACKTLAHELAHIMLGHENRNYAADRPACEVEAESVACIVSDLCGLDSTAYSVPYVANWAKDPLEAAERVLSVADEIMIGLASS